MVQILHSGENADKLNEIIATAQKRFGQYGYAKTSVNEIAADLGMSKGSVYYYFPDKENLYMAVVEKEHEEFLRKVKEQIQQCSDPEQMLRTFAHTNLLHYRTFLNLSRMRLVEFINMKTCMKDAIVKLRGEELSLISTILRLGNEQNLFHINNVEELAELYYDLYKGMRRMVVGKNELFYLEKDEYEALEKKANLLTELFINGIKYNNI